MQAIFRRDVTQSNMYILVSYGKVVQQWFEAMIIDAATGTEPIKLDKLKRKPNPTRPT
jgi:hypothetical protein